MFCNSLGVASCTVHDLNIVLPAVLNVDVICTDRMTDDAFSFVQENNNQSVSQSVSRPRPLLSLCPPSEGSRGSLPPFSFFFFPSRESNKESQGEKKRSL